MTPGHRAEKILEKYKRTCGQHTKRNIIKPPTSKAHRGEETLEIGGPETCDWIPTLGCRKSATGVFKRPRVADVGRATYSVLHPGLFPEYIMSAEYTCESESRYPM
jgi:hypothetical protein